MNDTINYFCPLCNKKTSIDNAKPHIYTDYACRSNLDTHFYYFRVQENKISALKLKLILDNSTIYCRIFYDQNKSEIWSQPNPNNKTIINQSLNLDMSNIPLTFNKLKTYLLFS